MNVRKALRSLSPRRHQAAMVAIAAAGSAAALVAAAALVDPDALVASLSRLVTDPWLTLGALALFALAFVVRAAVWTRVLPGLPLGHAWSAIHLALAGNHVLPFRLGEPLRVASVVRRARIPTDAATASTVTLRAGDLLVLVTIAWVLGAGNLPVFQGSAVPVVVAAIGLVVGVGVGWTWILRRRGSLRLPGPLVVAGTALAWFAESGIVLVAARGAGIDLGVTDAVFVTSVSVAAQVAAFTPGGFGTYEAGAVAAYAYLGHEPGAALAAALAAHALKTLYSMAAGAVALLWPAPSALGRLRLPRELPRQPAAPPPSPTQPVVLFMPAHNEEDSVGRVLARVPTRVRGHEVVALVVDDGSDDTTAAVARDAGAKVISLETNRGLGAAVRVGFEHALTLGPAAVAFCDADGEYAPEELEHLVGPILDGTADYVVGSRFSGRIERMLPHRRLGNRVLTLIFRSIARHPITDAQSGYRAFSAPAAAAAEIIHDFNYAQVLTLDLLAKGFRYTEVPISYRFRTTGRSFVRLGRYLRRVIPAVYRQLNRPGTSPVPRGGAQSSTT